MENLLRIQSQVIQHPRIKQVYLDKLEIFGNFTRVSSYSAIQYIWHNQRTDYSKKLKSSRRSDSVFRAKDMVYKLVQANIEVYKNKPVFITLTFAENLQNIKKCNALFSLFIKRFNYQFCTKLKYVSVIEFQKRGAIHYHLVVFNLPFIDMRELESCWGHGFTRIELVRDIKDMGAYLSKYLTKETFDHRLYGEKVYFSSRGLLRPQQLYDITYPLTDDNIIVNQYKGKIKNVITYKKPNNKNI